ncbi:AI-2E family transporter [Fodinibius sediminis]|uniref:Predicted PurR-regulated permease PerM n=1 Tax=Fodinibius sediminis TaxID=1214077 RepID=A0A521ALG7_9BACT|nr:AI-2E family transporter [Fodinibius sediminis]SMO35668.1 Predicted PurR-regulated permease PerM [Fodinibius sediminis]
MNKNSHAWLNERGQIILMGAGVAGLLFLMYLLQHLINPLGYALLIGIVLYPIRQQPIVRALLYATSFMAGLWLIYDSGHLLIPFVLAYVIAFIINPLVETIERRQIPRGAIATFFTVTSLGLIGGALFFAIPALVEQLSRLGSLLNGMATDTEGMIEHAGILSFFEYLGFEAEYVKSQLIAQIDMLIDEFYLGITTLSTTYLYGIGSVATVLFFIILMPFLCFFMIRDYEKIGVFVRSLITPQNVSTDYTTKITRIVGAYLRGQFIVVLISAVNLSVGFYLVGLPYALVLGVFAGLTNFIPTFGLWLSISICTLVGATLGEPWYQFLPGMYLVFGIEQVLESGLIVPRVVGKHVGLHPLLVMVSLLFFGFMFGILGLFIAVPSVALISIFYQQYKETKKISFLSGSELDSFIQQFDRESQKQKRKKQREMEKELDYEA